VTGCQSDDLITERLRDPLNTPSPPLIYLSFDLCTLVVGLGAFYRQFAPTTGTRSTAALDRAQAHPPDIAGMMVAITATIAAPEPDTSRMICSGPRGWLFPNARRLGGIRVPHSGKPLQRQSKVVEAG